MAKTNTKRRKPRKITPGPQAPAEVWSPAQLHAALVSGSRASKLKLLKRIGILDANGNLGARYRNWDDRFTRGPVGVDDE